MRKTIIKWVILIFLLAYATAMTIWANGEARRVSCGDIVVNIVSSRSVDSVTNHGVREELSRYPRRIKGQRVSEVDTRDIENYLSGLSTFEDVECSFLADGTLRVDVVPMIPEIRVFDHGKSYYINKNGKMIASKANFFADVPVVSGSFTRNFPASSVLSVVRHINSDPALKSLVAMIDVKDADNIILVPRILGHVINYGDTCRLKEKTKALMAFYRKVIPYKGWETYDTISVKFRGQVVASRRDKNRNLHGVMADDEEDMEEATLPDQDTPEGHKSPDDR